VQTVPGCTCECGQNNLPNPRIRPGCSGEIDDFIARAEEVVSLYWGSGGTREGTDGTAPRAISKDVTLTAIDMDAVETTSHNNAVFIVENTFNHHTLFFVSGNIRSL
jgi:hypothetical protein